MWNLNWELLREYFARDGLGESPRIAIETGTCRGAGTRVLARHFERVLTIELSPALMQESRDRLLARGIRNVEFFHGNSAQVLPGLLQALPRSQEPVFIFLDAHWSGDSSVPWQDAKWKGYGVDTAHLGVAGSLPSGPEQCPLLEELQAIHAHCPNPAFILIDDLKNLPEIGTGFENHEFPGENWSHLSRQALLSAVRPRLVKAREFRAPARWLLSLAGQCVQPNTTIT